MVNWRQNRFLQAVIAIQLAMLGLVGLAALGFDIPVVRQLVGFVYVTLIPGFLILYILRLHRLGTVETLLYSTGLSLAFVMFLGCFANMLLPLVGISKPISLLPLVISVTTTVAILCVVAYIRDRRARLSYFPYPSLPWSEILSPPALFLLLLVVLSILGTSLFNLHQNNFLQLTVIALIALVGAMVTFNKFIPPKLHPLAVFSIALALLWHFSLISQYFWGWDIHIEYYYQNLVLTNSFWEPSLASNLNAMLSITILTPIYSLLLSMDVNWIFKIVYPLIFSLVPLALFQAFRKQMDDRIAFFAVFFFMSFQVFTQMLGLPRQQIASLFFALSFLLLLNKEMAAIGRSALLLIYGFSIAVSHYGLAYFYLFYLVLALALLSLARSNTLINLWRRASAAFNKGKGSTEITNPRSTSAEKLPATNALSTSFVMLMVVFYLAWYMYTSSGQPFTSIVRIGDYLYRGLNEFLNPETRDPAILLAVGLASPAVTSVQRYIYLVLQYLTQLFIVVGVTELLFNLRKTRFQPIYIVIVLISALLLLLSIIVPYFAKPFNMTRIYFITLFFLAPFCVLGGITIFRWLFRVVPSRLFRASNNPMYLKLVVMLILIPYLLFNTAFIYAVTGDIVTSIALNPEMDYPRFNEQEVSGEEWLLSSMTTGSRVYADEFGVKLLYKHLPFTDVIGFASEALKISDDTYIYLRSLNVKQGQVRQAGEAQRKYVDLNSSPFGKEVLAYRNKIYDNGGAQVYYR